MPDEESHSNLKLYILIAILCVFGFAEVFAFFTIFAHEEPVEKYVGDISCEPYCMKYQHIYRENASYIKIETRSTFINYTALADIER